MKNIQKEKTDICPECKDLINEFIDHRMDFASRHAFMERISRCRREKGCYLCIELLKSFMSLRKSLKSLKLDVSAPDWLMRKILEKIQ